MFRGRGTLLSLAAAAVLGACGDDSTGLGDAQVRFVNAASSAPALDFTLDDQPVAQNVAVGQVTQCQRARPRFTAIRTLRAGTSNAYAGRINFTFAPQGGYATVVVGNDTIARTVFLSDAALAPGQGRGRLRVLNGIPAATNTDIFVTAPGAALGTANQANVAWGTPSIFFDVPAGQTQIRLRTVGTTTVAFTGDAFDVVAGQTRTVVITPGATPNTFRTTVFDPC
jgi:hypothetical protein